MVERGLAPGRDHAKALVMEGKVHIDGKRAEKPGQSVDENCEILLTMPACPYVSRGGLKLEKALDKFNISLKERVCADIGASSGGFTDCMLQNGAKLVYAVDVGYGQLDWKLRNDSRVIVMERTNARYLEPLEPVPSFASVDVSFISLALIFPTLARIGVSEVCTLIKPQFEAGKELVGKRGVVRDLGVHADVIERVLGFAMQFGFNPQAVDYSPVKGPNGNIEFLLHACTTCEPLEIDVKSIVDRAHCELA